VKYHLLYFIFSKRECFCIGDGSAGSSDKTVEINIENGDASKPLNGVADHDDGVTDPDNEVTSPGREINRAPNVSGSAPVDRLLASTTKC
jgi:hypothetical protein